MKLKLSFLAFTMVVAMQLLAAPVVQNVIAKQRFPWNGLVDITGRVTGIEKSQSYKFYIEAVQPDEGITNKVAQFWLDFEDSPCHKWHHNYIGCCKER